MLAWVVNYRPQPRQIPPFLSVHPTFPILELVSLALLLSLAALYSKSIQQSLSNQSLLHSFSKTPGSMGLPHKKSKISQLRITMNEQSINSSSTNDLPRCQHRTRTGRRCRHAVSNAATGLCTKHAPSRANHIEESDLSTSLTAGLTEFKSAVPINEFLSRLLLLSGRRPHLPAPRRRHGLYLQFNPPHPPRHRPRTPSR